MNPLTFDGAACPLPIQDYPRVLLAHGGGGRLSHRLIESLFVGPLANPALEARHDGATLTLPAGERLAFSTDSYVISPLEFPGGNIGELAVYGTVNDLAMCGARPLALSLGLILEEGLEMGTLWRIAQAIQRAAARVGVPIVTGDTKVVERGKADGCFINTSGVGLIAPGVEITPQRARPGDVVLVSGPIAAHGIAILSVREGLEFETTIESDCAPLHELSAALLAAAGAGVHVLRDPTRGGVASALNEIAEAAGVGIALDEQAIPVDDQVRAACELLGFDPLYVANEGKLIALVAPEAAESALAALRAHPLGASATRIGAVIDEHPGRVVLRSRVGGRRVVDMLSGEQLPRIC